MLYFIKKEIKIILAKKNFYIFVFFKHLGGFYEKTDAFLLLFPFSRRYSWGLYQKKGGGFGNRAGVPPQFQG
jgi:hypothetical protein